MNVILVVHVAKGRTPVSASGALAVHQVHLVVVMQHWRVHFPFIVQVNDHDLVCFFVFFWGGAVFVILFVLHPTISMYVRHSIRQQT